MRDMNLMMVMTTIQDLPNEETSFQDPDSYSILLIWSPGLPVVSKRGLTVEWAVYELHNLEMSGLDIQIPFEERSIGGLHIP